MKLHLYSSAVLMLCFLMQPFVSGAQVSKDSSSIAHDTSQQKNLFDTDKVLEITLKGNIRELLNDRTNVNPQLYPLQLEYKNIDSSITSIAVKAKTRGHFRRLKENCYYPPVLLQFSNNDTLQSSIFRESYKLKLAIAMPGRAVYYSRVAGI